MVKEEHRATGLKVLLGMLAVFAFGCGSDVPTSSTSVSTAASSSVRLNGSFASSGGSALRDFTQSELDDITVEVEGTNITTQVRSDGSFSLRGLPVGLFNLIFRDENGAVIGEIAFGNVLSGQSIEILLRLEEDGSVTLLEERRDGVILEGHIVGDDDSSSDDSESDDSSSDDSESSDSESNDSSD